MDFESTPLNPSQGTGSTNAPLNAPEAAPERGPGCASVCRAGQSVRLAAPPCAAVGEFVQWEQVAGPDARMDDPSSPEPLVQVPQNLVNTKLTFDAIPVSGQTPPHSVSLWVAPDADSPAADAGATQVVAEGEVVLLDGRGTRLPAGWSARDVGWEWRQVAGPPVALSDHWSLTPAFRAPEGLVSSDVRFALCVSIGDATESGEAGEAGGMLGLHSISTVDLLVCSADDSLPVEAASVPRAPAGDVVTLRALVKGATENDLRWRWQQSAGPPVELLHANSPTPSFAAPPNWRNVALSFQVKVHDKWRTGKTEVSVLIEPDDQAARVQIEDQGEVADGDLVALEAQLCGADLKGWSVRWIQLEGPPTSLLTDPEKADSANLSHISFVAPDLDRTRIQLACIATKDKLVTIGTTQVLVVGDEDAPLVQAGRTQRARTGSEVQLVGRACGDEERPVRVLWRQTRGPRVSLSDPGSPRTSFHAPAGPGDQDSVSITLQFALHAFRDGLEAVDTVSILIGDTSAFVPPQTPGRLEAAAGERVSLGHWNDTDLEQLEACVWRQVAGPQVLLENENGPGAWFRAPEGYANTKLSFELDAVVAGRRVLDSVEVLVEPDEDAPVALSSADRRASPRELVRLSAFVRDPNGLSLESRWRQVAGPPVELDDPSALRPTFAAPACTRPQTLVFQFTVTDGVVTVAESMRVHVRASQLDRTEASPLANEADQDLRRAG